jgi:23S rRNA (uracil1939-C5)-methyltransferase
VPGRRGRLALPSGVCHAAWHRFMAAHSCPHAAACPGCPLIERDLAEQLAFKRDVVVRALATYPALTNASVAEPIPAEPVVGYRVRAKLAAEAGKLGLYARGSHELVDVPECLVLRPRLREVARQLRGTLPAAISAVDLREADDGVLVTLIARDDAEPSALEALARELAARVPAIAGVALSSRALDSAQLLGGEPRSVVGPVALRYHFDPLQPWGLAAHGAFTQAHAGQAARLHASIEALLAARLGRLAGSRLLELHAGSGLLALRLAARGARVTLVEAYEPATQRAREAALAQGLELDVIAGDASRVVAELSAAGQRFDAVLVNPARRGLEPELRQRIAALAPRCLVYVSCSPRSLARDAADFARQGLTAQSFQPLDMIPLSDAVEVLAELVPEAQPPPRVIAEDAALIAVEKPPHESMAALLARVRTLPGAESAAIVQRLHPGVSGVCVFSRRAAGVADLARALLPASRRYAVLVKGETKVRGVSAETRFERRRLLAGHSLLAASVEREQPTQLERQLAAIRHPVLGDSRHGDAASNAFFWHRFGLDRAFLHLEQLAFELAGRRCEFRSELSPDLVSVLEAMAAAPAGADHDTEKTS